MFLPFIPLRYLEKAYQLRKIEKHCCSEDLYLVSLALEKEVPGQLKIQLLTILFKF